MAAPLGSTSDGFQNSVYMQIGIIMIIGLAAKNAILIVEFAKERVDNGMDPLEAAVEASRLRFRPILMTAFTSIIACRWRLQPVRAQGPDAAWVLPS
jgi:multidrug efflux pump subunit AcrB